MEDSFDGGNALSIFVYLFGNAWILNLACPYHMCPHHDWFSTYHLINGGLVLKGNNIFCKVVGIGTI